MNDKEAAIEARKRALQAQMQKLDSEAKKLEEVKLEFSQRRKKLEDQQKSERLQLEKKRQELIARQNRELSELKAMEDKIGFQLLNGEPYNSRSLSSLPLNASSNLSDSDVEVDGFQIFTSQKPNENNRKTNQNKFHNGIPSLSDEESSQAESANDSEEENKFFSSSEEENDEEMSQDDDYAPVRIRSSHVEMRPANPQKSKKKNGHQSSLDQKWQEMYQQLKEWKEEHGSCNVPQKKNRSLCYWVYTQKILVRREKLDPDRKNLLLELGMVLSGPWEEQFQQLKKYKKDFGTLWIDFNTHQELYEWTREQIKLWKRGSLSHERVAKLKEVGLTTDMAFTQRIKRDKKEEYESENEEASDVEDTSEEEAPVAGTVTKRKQRSDFSDIWNTTFAEMKLFRQRFFHSHPDRNTNKRLSKWCENQRYYILKNILSPDRMSSVCEIGLDLSMWDDMYGALVKHKELQGHLNYIDGDDVLNTWFAKQKRLWSHDKLTDEQIEQLEALGLDRESDSQQGRAPSKRSAVVAKQKVGIADGSDKKRKFDDGSAANGVRTKKGRVPDDAVWNSRYEELVDFKDKTGHCYPSKNTPRIYRWLLEQKNVDKKGLLNPQKKQLLSEIGVHFDSDWDRLFTKVKSVKVAANPNKLINEVITDPSLLHWLSRQLLGWTRGWLTDERKELFQKIDISPSNYADIYKTLYIGGKEEDSP